MEDVAQIIFVFFLKRKNPIYSLIQREIPYCRLEQSLTRRVLIAHSTLFSSVSSGCNSFERNRLHQVLLNCGSADRGTSGNSVKMQICSRCALGEMYLHGNEHSRSHSLKCLGSSFE